MKQVFAISTAIFTTIWRKKVPVYGVLLVCIALGALSYFSPEARVNFSGFTTHVKISIFVSVALILVFSFLTGITLISESFENWSIHLMKVRPVSGFNYFMGQTLGLSFSMSAIFIVITLTNFLFIFSNYKQLPREVRLRVMAKYQYAEVGFSSRNTDFQKLAKDQLISEGINISSDQIFLRSRKLKVASHELMALEEKQLFFDNVSLSSETYLKVKLKISGDVFGVKREFSHIQLIYFLPHKKISTTTVINFESGEPIIARIPSSAISEDGTVKIGIVNTDQSGRPFYFSSEKGIRLTQKGSNLLLNVVKFTLLSILNIVLFSAGGLLLGLMFSSAVSFFFSFAYFTIATFADLGILPPGISRILYFTFRSPFSLPFASSLTNGVFISMHELLSHIFFLILGFLMLLGLAHLIYTRREVAAVMRTK